MERERSVHRCTGRSVGASPDANDGTAHHDVVWNDHLVLLIVNQDCEPERYDLNSGRDDAQGGTKTYCVTNSNLSIEDQEKPGEEIAQRVLSGEADNNRDDAGPGQQSRTKGAQFGDHMGEQHETDQIGQNLRERTYKSQGRDIRKVLTDATCSPSDQQDHDRRKPEDYCCQKTRSDERIRVRQTCESIHELIQRYP